MGETQVIRQWINPLYLADETIKQVPETFYANHDLPRIQLSNFFLEEKAQSVKKRLDNVTWKKQYIPHMHSFSKPANDKANNKKICNIFSVLASSGFKSLLGTMLRTEFKDAVIEPLLFQHGDYTLLHDAYEHKKVVACYLDFTKDWNDASGGQLVFVTKSRPIIFPRVFNAAQIVLKTEDAQCFMKYVNSAAGKNKVYLVKVVLN